MLEVAGSNYDQCLHRMTCTISIANENKTPIYRTLQDAVGPSRLDFEKKFPTVEGESLTVLFFAQIIVYA